MIILWLQWCLYNLVIVAFARNIIWLWWKLLCFRIVNKQFSFLCAIVYTLFCIAENLFIFLVFSNELFSFLIAFLNLIPLSVKMRIKFCSLCFQFMCILDSCYNLIDFNLLLQGVHILGYIASLNYLQYNYSLYILLICRYHFQ